MTSTDSHDTGATRRGTKRDPHRRAKIADAAERVIAEHGLRALTHRAVAEAADVPLGATTYYFKDLDDLIRVTLERHLERFTTLTRQWAEQHVGTPRDQLPALLADGVLGFAFGPARPASVVSYELYLAALTRPALHPLAARYNQLVIEQLTSVVDRPTAATLAYLMDGIILRCLLTPTPPPRAELEDHIRRVLTQAPTDAT